MVAVYVFYLISSLAFVLCFVDNPNESVQNHTRPFTVRAHAHTYTQI
jgi:hypothetical protein